ncbi:MAG: hypothetical protein IJB46_03850, partial [Prevotella sp.]|nr:hypothetical protein [Prevotella sp.]
LTELTVAITTAATVIRKIIPSSFNAWWNYPLFIKPQENPFYQGRHDTSMYACSCIYVSQTGNNI